MMESPGFARDTSRRTRREWALGLAALFAGLAIAHLGVALFLASGLGSDPFTVFVQGLSNIIALSIGTVHVAMLILLMALMLLTTRGYVKPGTVVCAFAGGWIIDFFLWALGGTVGAAAPMALRLCAMALGVIILSFGMSIVIRTNSGTGPNDLVAMILSDKLRAPFRYVRIACDLLFAGLGYLLGGTLGVGTVAAVLLTGPAVQFFLPLSGKILRRLCPGL